MPLEGYAGECFETGEVVSIMEPDRQSHACRLLAQVHGADAPEGVLCIPIFQPDHKMDAPVVGVLQLINKVCVGWQPCPGNLCGR